MAKNVITNARSNNSNAPLHPAVVAKVDEVKAKIREIAKGKDVEIHVDDLSTGIANSRHLLFNFLMDNNINSLAMTLKSKLREKIDINPTRQQVEGIIAAYIAKGDYNKLNVLLQDFKYNGNANNYTTDRELLARLLEKFK